MYGGRGEIPESSRKQNLNLSHQELFTHHLHCDYNNLHNIYIVYGIVSSLCLHAQSLQSYGTTCQPYGTQLLGSSVHALLKAKILEWVAMPFL